jgi:hypothetical protein
MDTVQKLGIPDSLHQIWHSYSLRLGVDFRKVRTPESVLSSNPGECGSCSSETKHNRRTASRPKLFVSKRRLQVQWPESLNCRESSPGEVGYVAWKLITIEKRRKEQSCLFWQGDYRK